MKCCAVSMYGGDTTQDNFVLDDADHATPSRQHDLDHVDQSLSIPKPLPNRSPYPFPYSQL